MIRVGPRGGKSWRYSKSKSRSRSPSVDRFGRSKRKDNKAVEEEDDTRAEPGMKTEEMERQRKIRASEMQAKFIEEETQRRIDDIVMKRVEEELAKRKIDVDEEVMRKVE